MSEDAGSVNKLSGVWMQLDAILHRENRANIWEQRDEYAKVAPKKKEKLKLSTGGSRYLHKNGEKSEELFALKSNRKKDKNDKFKTDDGLSDIQNWPTETEYINPIIECSFSLTRVSAQLERLMGTNVVRLTDRKYMMELRQRIHEDFNEMLAKRIENREVKEMERQRNLFMEGKITQGAEDYSSHPIFIVNQTAEPATIKRRSKLKTNRQKNAERLLRQGAKWEKERQKIHEIEKQRELEEKARQEAAINMVNDFHSGGKDRGMKLPRLRNYVDDSELALKELSDDDNSKSTYLNGKSKTKDRRMNSTFKSENSERNAALSPRTDDEENGTDDEQIALSHGSRSHRSQTIGKADADNLQYEDPMVSELKQTESVKDMYKLANVILGGKGHANSTVTEVSSEEEAEGQEEAGECFSDGL